MSGFFSLGGAFDVGKDQEHQNDQNQEQEDSVITPNSLYLFKNEEIYSKGFELWQQYYQLHQHRQQHHQQPPSHYDLGVAGGGVSRRRSSTSGVDDLCLNSSNNNNNNITNNNSSNSNLYSSSSWRVMRQGGYVIGGGDHGGGGGGGGGSGGGVNCQDCGNQAKKDCQHMRCRTCCKSRGFQCQTHVKSTWVPAGKRRERQQQLASLTQQQQHHDVGNQQLSLMMRGGGSGGGGGGIDQNAKRLREDHHLITTAGGGGAVIVNLPSAHHHHNTSSALEMGHFPAEVSSPAVFRCVRVSAMDDAEEQLAYQTAVSIGGHVFKGILYDHGVGGGDSSSAAGDGGGSQHQPLNLITSGTMGAATATVNPNVTSIDPSTIYPTPLNAFMAGTQFFPPPRS